MACCAAAAASSLETTDASEAWAGSLLSATPSAGSGVTRTEPFAVVAIALEIMRRVVLGRLKLSKTRLDAPLVLTEPARIQVYEPSNLRTKSLAAAVLVLSGVAAQISWPSAVCPQRSRRCRPWNSSDSTSA